MVFGKPICRKLKILPELEGNYRIFVFFSGPDATESLQLLRIRALKGPAKFIRPLRGLLLPIRKYGLMLITAIFKATVSRVGNSQGFAGGT